MALLKAFVCQVVLLGLYKLFLEQVFEDYLVPDELTRNCLVGFVCLLCFGIQLYTENVEEQKSHAESSKAKSRRRSPPDTAETVSEFLDARTAHMIRTLDAAMQQMNQMPMSDGYVHQNVVFAAAAPEAAVFEQTFAKQPSVVVLEEIHVTKLSDAMNANESIREPMVLPVDVEEVSEVKRKEEEVEESETKSDVCEEEEEDVVTVIDTSKPASEVKKTKPESEESEEEEEEEEEEEKEEEKGPTLVGRKGEKTEVRSVNECSEEEDEEEEEEEVEKAPLHADSKKVEKTEVKLPKEPSEDEEEEEEEEEEEQEVKQYARKETKKS